MSIKAAQRQLPTKDRSSDVARHLLDLEILYLLTPESRSGYELKKHLFNLFHINVSYGTLYPHLHSLEKSRLIAGNWDSRQPSEPMKKKMYNLTPTGSEKLRAGVDDLGKIALTMQFMLAGMILNTKSAPPLEDSEGPFRVVEQFLSSRGYSVKRMALLRGSSGFEYPVELFATRHNASRDQTESLVIRVANSQTGLCVDDLLKFYVIAYDLQLTHAMMLSTNPVLEEVLKLADFYRIPIFHGKDLVEAASNMCSDFEAN